jgi:hypothetical protein
MEETAPPSPRAAGRRGGGGGPTPATAEKTTAPLLPAGGIKQRIMIVKFFLHPVFRQTKKFDSVMDWKEGRHNEEV